MEIHKPLKGLKYFKIFKIIKEFVSMSYKSLRKGR